MFYRNSSDEKYNNIFKEMLEYIHIRAESNETCLCQEAIMVCSKFPIGKHFSVGHLFFSSPLFKQYVM